MTLCTRGLTVTEDLARAVTITLTFANGISKVMINEMCRTSIANSSGNEVNVRIFHLILCELYIL